MMSELIHLDEPSILFRHEQAMDDPRDGLSLFGPLDKGKPYGIRTGIIGTRAGVQRFKRWLQDIHKPIIHEDKLYSRPLFPGFNSAFQCEWDVSNTQELFVNEVELFRHLYDQDQHYRVYYVSEQFAKAIIQHKRDEHPTVDIWFVVIPDEIYRYCRPNSVVPANLITHKKELTTTFAKEFISDPSLFDSITNEIEPYRFEVNFREQLKSKLLKHQIPTQVIRESTIAPNDFLNKFGQPKRKLASQLSQIAWTLSTAAFYKAGGRPWKLSAIRKGVCYVGLAFKVDSKSKHKENACCAAQMFLDSGDGVVFKGAVGPWYSSKTGEFHLPERRAFELISLALSSYKAQHDENLPSELFIHAKHRFDRKEWKGFQEAAGENVNLVGVTIKPTSNLKLYKGDEYPVMRGFAYIQSETSAYLWTKGYVPRLRTSTALEVPNPLYIEICKGKANIKTVLEDILALTKLNYNSCIYGDGLPVTLRFAESVGEILVAGPNESLPPLSFKFYI